VPDATDLRPGDPEEIAGYRVVSRLGAGGQGVVYLATASSGERVAIKQLRFGPQDERARQQFAKEVAAARLVAPFCTAQVLDAELEGPAPYVVSEYIEGLSLQQRIERRGPMTGAALHRLAIGTATALAAIHQAGVVHRDFKPANVMLAYDGPRVIDFGIARDLSTETTVTSRVFGTPAYMAPEQLRAERVGPATDMFAWASVIAYAATGQAPFEAPHMVAVMHRISAEEPDLAGVPPELVGVLRQCLDKDPPGRPSAQQVLALLLGRPAPEHDASDATQVLAEATGIVHAAAATATTQDPPVPALQAQPSVYDPPGPTVPAPAPTVQHSAPAPTVQQHAAPAPTVQHPAPAPTVRQATPAVLDPPAVRPWGDGNVALPPGTPSGRAPDNPWVRLGIVVGVLALAAAAMAGIWMVGLGGLLDNGRRDQNLAHPTVSSSSAAGPRGAEPNTEPSSTEPSKTQPATPDPVVTSALAPIPEVFDGRWEGVGLQPRGRVKSWSVQVKLDEGKYDGKLKLDSLDCSGELTLVWSSPNQVQLLAKMDDNPEGACAASGVVWLTSLGSDRMRFDWQDGANSQNRATGVLRKH
jgi:predicted Ser/Thr protein kinase